MLSQLWSGPREPTLDELALRHGTDKSSALNAFAEKYVAYLEPRRRQPLTLLEIGVYRGASLRMWRDYFPEALVLGADIAAESLTLDDFPAGIRLCPLDQSDRSQLAALGESVATERGGFDIVIDDGSHICSHQVLTFQVLFPFVKPGGAYFVEDVTTSYRPEPYGGGLGRPDTFLRFATDLVPFIEMSMGCAPAREPWERDIDFVHFHGYGGLVVVGKLTPERRARISDATSG